MCAGFARDFASGCAVSKSNPSASSGSTLRSGMSRSPLIGQRPDLCQDIGHLILGYLALIVCLQVRPEALGCAEESGKTQPCIDSDATLTRNDLADAPLRHTDLFCQPILSDLHRLQELFHQDLARVGVGNFMHGCISSMVIHDLNLLCIRSIPHETYTPLLVDSYAVLAFTVSCQGLQPIAWWDTKVLQGACGIEHSQFTHSNFLNVYKSTKSLAIEQCLGIAAFECLNRHG